MKKIIRILVPTVLVIVIIACSVWYLFVYDRALTRDLLLSCARSSERNGYHDMATWFYNKAYSHDGNSDAVAIELAQQYIDNDNYTKAEYTLSNAISDGGGIDVYIKLCQTFVAQDKLIDAVNMLNGVKDPEIKAQLDKMRPDAPIFSPDPNANNNDDGQGSGEYDQYIDVFLSCESGTVYATSDGTYPTVNAPFSKAFTMKGGTNTIKALVINDKGLVSQLEERKYLIHGVVEEIDFVDPTIEAAVRSLLGVSETKKILTSDLWTINEFTVPTEASKYDDLKHMIYLETLTIENGVSGQLSAISLDQMTKLRKLTIINVNVSQEELKVIAQIPELHELTLRGAGLSGISPIKDAVKLTKLDISENSVGVLDPLKYLTNLRELNLSNNAVTDLSALSKITELIDLNVSINQIVTLAPVSSLINLSRLDASENRISVLGNIGNLTKLTVLYLNKNNLTSISGLETCTKITDLDLSENQLVDISAISTMDSIMHLNFANNLVVEMPDFSSDCDLVTIDGSFNLLSDLSPLSGLKSLNTVNMEGNTEITSLEPLANCRNLFRVNVLDTKVTEVRVLTDKSIAVLYRQPELTTEEDA